MLSSKRELSVPTYQVHTTTDYSMFKSIDGNRNLNLLHINRLKKSMQEHYLFTVIVVNENYEIIDGQHRFNAVRDLGLPLHYVIMQGYNLSHVQILNANSSNWTTQDYLEAYCNLGYEDYVRLAEFLRKYKLNITIGASILLQSSAGIAGTYPGSAFEYFKHGTLKITEKQMKDGAKFMEMLYLFEPYFDGFKSRSFVFSLMKLMNNPDFSITELLQKVKIQPSALQSCVHVNQMTSLIEEIYNYKRRDKVNLRF
jgi:hypothetical protein